jgi:hypothetical protein
LRAAAPTVKLRAQHPREFPLLDHLRRALAALVLLVALGSGALAQPTTIAVQATPVPLRADDSSDERVGQLVYRGGLALTASHPRFGGWSDLWVAPDGSHLIAISDRASWMELRLVHDAAGRLVGAPSARIAPLIDQRLRPLHGPMGDSEGLARLPDGSFLVSFERRHRVWLYPAGPAGSQGSGPGPFARPPQVLPTPPGVEAAPYNGSLEAIARLADGRIALLAEDLVVDGAHAGWLFAPTTMPDGTWSRFGYRPERDLSPAGAVGLPDGDLLVLERGFRFLLGFRARIARVPAAQLQPGAVAQGAEVARLDPRFTVDNFEGIAARIGPRGETLLYVISDDNFNSFQRTLLMVFALEE